MRYWVGFDVGKAFHWVCVLDDEGEVVISRRVEATERDLEDCCEEIAALSGERRVATDLLGGPAALLETILIDRGERVFHLPGTAVNRACDGYRGEHKSDRADAKVIADQLRMRWRSLREVQLHDDAVAELRALVAHRRGMVEDQARIITRLRALLLEVFPGLEAALDLRKDRALLVVTRVATPSVARRLGLSRLARWLRARDVRRCEDLAGKVVEAAKGQKRELPAAEAKAALASEMSAEVLRAREMLDPAPTTLADTDYLDKEGVFFTRTKEIRVERRPRSLEFTVDEEIIGDKPASFPVIPQALKVIVGPGYTPEPEGGP